jgi:hypothetical protein
MGSRKWESLYSESLYSLPSSLSTDGRHSRERMGVRVFVCVG